MFTGMMIDELIHAVEKAEQQSRAPMAESILAALSRRDAAPAFTYLYDFGTMQQMVIGVA